MARLKPAIIAGGLAIAATLLLVLFRGILTGAWVPWDAAIVIAVALGIAAMAYVASMPGGGGKQAARPGGMPPGPARDSAPSIVPTVGSALQESPAAPILIETPQTAVVFLQHFPPAFDPGHLSYFGGLPTVPPGFIWPTWIHEGRTEPLHFVMQIDCAAVPASARHEAFPTHGVLYFFLDLRRLDQDGCRVLYAENTDALAPASAPAGLAAVNGAGPHYAWHWTEALPEPETRLSRLLPKWPFDPVGIKIPSASIESWGSEIDADNEHPVFWWPEQRVMDAVLLEAQEARRGVVAPIDPMAPPQAGFSRPYATYPQDWRAIEIGAGLLLARVKQELRNPKSSNLLREMSSEQLQAMSDRIVPEVRGWITQAAGHAPFEATSEPTRDAFWSWLESWRRFSAVMINQAANLSIEASLAESAEAASRLPMEAIARIRSGHALATRTTSGLFADTPDRMLAPPSFVQGNQDETAATHLLLLELSANDGLAHHFAEGVYQIWITPDDLRARRFDRAMCTTTAY